MSCKIQSYGLQLVSWEAFYLVIVLLNVAINILSPTVCVVVSMYLFCFYLFC